MSSRLAISEAEQTKLVSEFVEFSKKQVVFFLKTFEKYDLDGDNFLNLMELKMLLEKLGEPHTHLAVKELIKKADLDKDGKLSRREFLILFRLAVRGEEMGTAFRVFKKLADVFDVQKEGVKKAALHFQAKIDELMNPTAGPSRFEGFPKVDYLRRREEELKAEEEEKERLQEEKRLRREQFNATKSMFSSD